MFPNIKTPRVSYVPLVTTPGTTTSESLLTVLTPRVGHTTFVTSRGSKRDRYHSTAKQS